MSATCNSFVLAMRSRPSFHPFNKSKAPTEWVFFFERLAHGYGSRDDRYQQEQRWDAKNEEFCCY
jgi:hypothetical protein